ncbi:unnamed protein product [Peronospora belbahrii]|uniref:Uncharacterized protein n=1 Tax=Peronospora belbahrii TaxID=622444 RepID=A0AAU9KN27_9STRA|nr:unnamed protein product [Peronospora belbahrii]
MMHCKTKEHIEDIKIGLKRDFSINELMSLSTDVPTPADSNSNLIKIPAGEVFVLKFPYRERIIALMYIAKRTRPDIAHAVGEAAKFCERHPALNNWLCLLPEQWRAFAELQASTDSCYFKHRSRVYEFIQRNSRVNLAAASSHKSEVIDQAAKTIFQDNKGCIALAKNPVYHERTKQIDIKCHFLLEKALNEVITLGYKSTEEMAADGITKALLMEKHSNFLTSLNMAVCTHRSHIKEEY